MEVKKGPGGEGPKLFFLVFALAAFPPAAALQRR